MIDLTRHPRLLRVLSLWDRLLAKLWRKDDGRREAERNLAAFYAGVWKEAAAALGAEIEHLGEGAYEIRLGDARTRLSQNATDIDGLAGHRVVRMKGVMYRLLACHGLPVPRFTEFDVRDMRPAVTFLEGTQRACVVKPASGTGGGAGVATGIRTRWQLARAAFAAGRHGDDVIIEEEVAGDNYRLLYLDGRLLDAVLRRPPAVTGDGTSAIGQLVAQANACRVAQGAEESHDLLRVDIDMKRTLARQGLSLRSVPARGTRVAVKTAINENSGADNEAVTERLGEALVEEAGRAAALSGLRLAGVDVISGDPTKSLADAGGVVLEVNSPPGYYWHYHKQGGACPVARHVLEVLLGSRQPKHAGEVLCNL
jgi:cyanophycin synthetase